MATKDRTSLKNDFANGKYATGEKFADLIDSMKVVQLPVVDPQALGTSLSFIDSISQDADGKITATKKTLDLANAHELNPFKGWYKTGDTLPTDGFDGAYLYFKDTSELTGQTTIYRWNGTTYADTGTVVDTSNVQTFGSGQQVNSVKIKDESGEEVTVPVDVLSAEAGKRLKEEKIDVIQGYDTTQNLLTADRVYQVNGFPNYSTNTAESLKKIEAYNNALYVGINIEGLPHKGLLLKINNDNFIFRVATFFKKHTDQTHIEFPDGWEVSVHKTVGLGFNSSGTTASYGSKAYTNRVENSVVRGLDVLWKNYSGNTELYLKNIPDGVNGIGLLITSAGNNENYYLGSLTDYPQAIRNVIVAGITLTSTDGTYNIKDKVDADGNALNVLEYGDEMAVETAVSEGRITNVWASCSKLNYYAKHRWAYDANTKLYNYTMTNRNSGSDFRENTIDTKLLANDNIMPFALHFEGRSMGYVGGNHGFRHIVKLTLSNNHNLTDSAVGEIFGCGNNNYGLLLVSIISQTEIYACPVTEQGGVVKVYTEYEIGTLGGGTITIANVDVPFTAQTALNNGLYPALMLSTVKNAFYINGEKEVADEVAVNCRFLDYVVSYDVRDFDFAMQYLYDNRGNNTSETWFGTEVESGMTGLIHTEQIWRMRANGSITILNRSVPRSQDVVHSWNGGIQSTPNQSNTTYFCVPATSNYDGSTGRPLASTGGDKTFNSLKNADYPPIRYYQFEYNDTTHQSTKVCGYSPLLGNGMPEVRKTTDGGSSRYGWMPNTRKMYLSINGENNRTTENVAFWCPVNPSNQPTFTNTCWYEDFEGNVFLMIDENESLDGYIILPREFDGKKVVPVDGDVFGSIEVGYTVINGRLRCTIENYGSGSYLIRNVY